jgi:hypothetical protein
MPQTKKKIEVKEKEKEKKKRKKEKKIDTKPHLRKVWMLINIQQHGSLGVVFLMQMQLQMKKVGHVMKEK